MDKNSIVGLILIAMVLFGFTYVQKRRYENQMAQSVQETEAAQPVPGSTQDPAAASFTGDSQTEQPQVITYKDSLLTLAASGNELFYTLENESLKLTFTTKDL